jgi:hypothetical protein
MEYIYENTTKDRFNSEFGTNPKMTPVIFPFKEKIYDFIEKELLMQKEDIYEHFNDLLSNYSEDRPVPPAVIRKLLDEI